MVKTHFGNLASPLASALGPHGIKRGRIWRSKSFPSSGELSGSPGWVRRVCSDQVEPSQQHFGRESCCFSLTLVLKCWKILVFEVQIRQIQRILHGGWLWKRSLTPVTLMMSPCEKRQIAKNCISPLLKGVFSFKHLAECLAWLASVDLLLFECTKAVSSVHTLKIAALAALCLTSQLLHLQ